MKYESCKVKIIVAKNGASEIIILLVNYIRLYIYD